MYIAMQVLPDIKANTVAGNVARSPMATPTELQLVSLQQLQPLHIVSPSASKIYVQCQGHSVWLNSLIERY